MTDKQFFASKWKPFEVMTLYIKDLNQYCECYLIGIEFEDKTMKVRPIDGEVWDDKIYNVKIDIITRGKDKSILYIKK